MQDQATLVTGAAGFIGFHTAKKLLDHGAEVVGLDNLNDYYDVRLKQARLQILQGYPGFQFVLTDLADREGMKALFAKHGFPVVVHLAAQAGVRYSIEHPHTYVESNLEGFINILEGCRHNDCRHLLYASSSSVYGNNTKLPFSVHDNVDHPISLYAATKKANELMGHSYSHLFRIPMTGLRFFTVYGPWGRPDMAMFIFAKAISEGKPIKLFNYGKMKRDFTYVDDVVEAIYRLIDRAPKDEPASLDRLDTSTMPSAPWKVYNVGNSRPEDLMHVVQLLESKLGKKAICEFLPIQPGDVLETYADVQDLERDIDFIPATTIEQGINQFVDWYRYYKNSEV